MFFIYLVLHFIIICIKLININPERKKESSGKKHLSSFLPPLFSLVSPPLQFLSYSLISSPHLSIFHINLQFICFTQPCNNFFNIIIYVFITIWKYRKSMRIWHIFSRILQTYDNVDIVEIWELICLVSMHLLSLWYILPLLVER